MPAADADERPEERFAWFAARQHNCVTVDQALEECGFSRSALHRRVERGLYVRRFRGVYGVNGGEDGWRSHLLGAILAAGPMAVADGRSAAALWQIPDLSPPPVPQIIVPGLVAPRIGGVRAGAVAWLTEDDVTTVGGISSLRTEAMLLRLAKDLRSAPHQRAAAHLLRHQQLRLHRFAELVARSGPVPGLERARATLGFLDPLYGRTASVKEVGALWVVLTSDLPRPLVNAPRRLSTGRLAVFDLLFMPEMVVREVDSHVAHSAAPDMRRDRNRDREARADGYDLERWMWEDIEASPEAFVQDCWNAIRQQRERLGMA